MTITALFTMGSVAILLIGTVAHGVADFLLPSRLPRETPLVALARLHYLLVGASVFTLFATTYLWLIPSGGQQRNQAVGRRGFWMMFLGFNGAFLPSSIPGGGPPLLLDPLHLWSTMNVGIRIGVLLFLSGTVVTTWHIIVAWHQSRA